MQVFRQAIRDVVRKPQYECPLLLDTNHVHTYQASKHSFGAEQYWEWARIFSRLAHTDIDNGLSDLIVPFLDISKEGELQGQIKSIVRDLEIMLRITIEQKEVVERFVKTILRLAGGRSNPDVEPLILEMQSNIEDLEDMRRSTDDISASVSCP